MKPLSDFAGSSSKGKKLDSYCRPCRAEYGREHYLANRQRYIDQAQRRKEELRTINYELLIEFLRAHPCVDCGEADVLVLEFDHVAGKSFQIAAALRDRSWSEIVVESRDVMWSVPTATDEGRPSEVDGPDSLPPNKRMTQQPEALCPRHLG